MTQVWEHQWIDPRKVSCFHDLYLFLMSSGVPLVIQHLPYLQDFYYLLVSSLYHVSLCNTLKQAVTLPEDRLPRLSQLGSLTLCKSP